MVSNRQKSFPKGGTNMTNQDLPEIGKRIAFHHSLSDSEEIGVFDGFRFYSQFDIRFDADKVTSWKYCDETYQPEGNGVQTIFMLTAYKKLPSRHGGARLGSRRLYGFEILPFANFSSFSLIEVENEITTIAESYPDLDISGFYVCEIPFNYSYYVGKTVSERWYLPNGKLWQKSNIPDISRYPGFKGRSFGRNPTEISFCPGEMVEFLLPGKTGIGVGIVTKMPFFSKNLDAERKRQKTFFTPNAYSDCYEIVYWYINSDGEECGGKSLVSVPFVFAPSYDITDNMHANINIALNYVRQHKISRPENYWGETMDVDQEASIKIFGRT